MLFSCLSVEDYPIEELDRLWKILLINQFHDIIPGSSINLVYQTTHAEYEQIQEGCDQLINQSAKKLFKQDSESFVLLNTLSYSWKGSVKIPESFENHHILDEGGNEIPLQRTEEGVFALVELNALSFTTFKKGDSVVIILKKMTIYHLKIIWLDMSLMRRVH